jgi:hypothetical protein
VQFLEVKHRQVTASFQQLELFQYNLKNYMETKSTLNLSEVPRNLPIFGSISGRKYMILYYVQVL